MRTSVNGGVSYRRTDLAPRVAMAESANDASSVSRWETERIVIDQQEHDRAIKVRGAALSEVTKVCTRTSFGLIAPADREAELDAAQEKARTMVREFNEGARTTRIAFGMLKGRIAASDEEAVRAITAEVSGLVSEMNQAIDKLDPEAIRAAATKAQSMLSILGEDEQRSVTAAVEAARKAARMIVKRAKEGEPGAVILADIQRGALERARIAFLDLDEDRPALDESAILPTVDLARTAGLDLTSEDGPAVEVPTAPAAVAFDLDDVG